MTRTVGAVVTLLQNSPPRGRSGKAVFQKFRGRNKGLVVTKFATNGLSGSPPRLGGVPRAIKTLEGERRGGRSRTRSHLIDVGEAHVIENGRASRASMRASIRWLRGIDRPPRLRLTERGHFFDGADTPPNLGGVSCKSATAAQGSIERPYSSFRQLAKTPPEHGIGRRR